METSIDYDLKYLLNIFIPFSTLVTIYNFLVV